MADVVMRNEYDHSTLSVKELNDFLPTYKHDDFTPPPAQHPYIIYRWIPICTKLPLTPQDELERLAKENMADLLSELDDGPLPVDGFMSPNLLDYIPPSEVEYISTISPPFTPCPPYSPPAPGGDMFLDHFHAEHQPLLFAKIGLHCYNLEKGANLELSGLPQVAHTHLFALEARDPLRNYTCKFETNVQQATENKDCFCVITTRCRTLPPPPPPEEEKEECGFDTLSVDELFKGNMPDWLPDDTTSKLLQYYEMKESEVEQAKEWLQIYAELAWYTKKQMHPYVFEYSKPFELGKVIVQSRGVVDPMKKVNKLDNAVFFISFKTKLGDVYKGIIRRTMDGNPEHLSLEAKCFM